MRTLLQLTVIFFVIYGGIAEATTKLWYHLDEKAPGEKARVAKNQDDKTATILNAVDPMQYTMVACTAGAYWCYGNNTYMPTYTNAFPSGHYLYDPVGRTVGTNAVGMSMFSSSNNGKGVSTLLYVKLDELPVGSAFTIEFFMRSLSTSQDVWETLAWYRNADKSTAFRLYANGESLSVRGTYVDEGGSSQTLSRDAGVTPHLLNKQWRHVALVVDSTTGAFRAYVDYAKVADLSFSGTLDMRAGGILYFGGDPSVNSLYSFAGTLDEIRVSDEALDPSRFLRVQRNDSPDLVSYESFEPSEDAFSFALRGETVSKRGTYELTSADVPVPELAAAPSCGGSTTNAVVFRGAGKAAALKANVDQHGDLFGDFTLESFVRIPVGQSGEKYLFNIAYLAHVRYEGSTLRALDKSYAQFAEVSGAADGRWHHTALVVDRTNQKMSLYYDYALVGTRTSAVLDVPAEDPDVYVGEWGDLANAYTNACYDSVRIVKQALSPSKFIRPKSSHADVVRIGFEPKANSLSYGVGFNGMPVQFSGKGSWSVSGECLPSALTYDGVTGEVGTANTLAFKSKANASGYGRSMRVPDAADEPLSSGSFTAEMLFRIDNVTVAGSWSQKFMMQTNAFAVAFEDSAIEAKDSTMTTFATRGGIATGRWHHLAYVQDVENDALRFYVDYRLVGEKKGVPPVAGRVQDFISVFGDSLHDSYGTFKDSYFDEVRFSRTALDPDSFLRRRRPSGLMAVIR